MPAYADGGQLRVGGAVENSRAPPRVGRDQVQPWLDAPGGNYLAMWARPAIAMSFAIGGLGASGFEAFVTTV